MFNKLAEINPKYFKIDSPHFLHLVGVIIFITPSLHVIEEPSLHGAGGYLFCYLLGNSFMAFFFGKASILIAMLLAIERWFSVIRPFSYKFYFTKKKTVGYILFIFVFSAVIQIHKILKAGFKNKKCVNVLAPGIAKERDQQAFVLSYVIGTFLIPSLITWASFLHIWYRTKASQSLLGISEQARAHQKRLLRMCIVTAVVMTACWLPSQITHTLNHFGFLTNARTVNITFAMLNSCLNPWIYFISNKEYRNEFFSLFSICITKRNTQVTPEIAMQENNTQMEEGNSVNVTSYQSGF